ncbi:hypothetical protein BJX64DRAFT_281119 [Aspergillus heterothallicus]
MVVIKRFRSLWGIEPGPEQSNWKKRFIEWKEHGYAGIEISFDDPKAEELQRTRKIADEVGLEISITLFSAWPGYIGPRPAGLTPEIHADCFREQLKFAKILKPVRINAQSGADYFTLDESVRFYQLALKVEKEEGFAGIVTHETHRNRSLFNPYAADHILQQVPELKITADISHWVVVSERLLDQGEEDKAILTRMIPRVGHLHARIGTTQSSQCPEPLNPIFTAEREFFDKLWVRIVKHRQETDPESTLTWVPEYGPYPYHPFNSAQTHDELADSEAKRLDALFAAALA